MAKGQMKQVMVVYTFSGTADIMVEYEEGTQTPEEVLRDRFSPSRLNASNIDRLTIDEFLGAVEEDDVCMACQGDGVVDDGTRDAVCRECGGTGFLLRKMIEGERSG